MIENTPEQLLNRHFAKLINKLEPLKIPIIANDAIRTEMFYLVKDILSLSNNKFKEQTDDRENFNK
jgi:hypothetical protein